MSKIFCPGCYASYEQQPECCTCGYPFTGSEMDKYKFMSKKIKKVNIVKEGKKSADYARLVLFIIGALNLLVSIIFLLTKEQSPIHVVTLVYSLLLIILGLVSFKEPFLSLLLGLIVLILIYIFTAVIDSNLFMNGIISRIIFISGFIYGIVKVKKADKILKE
jgi:hypothetical protein